MYLKVDIGWFLVQSNPYRLQLFLKQPSLNVTLASIQHHQDHISRASHRNHLTTTPLPCSMHVSHMTNAAANA